MTDDSALTAAVLEIERHVGASGWDRPPQLFALVDTAALRDREPSLAQQVGIDQAPVVPGSLTPIEQEPLPADSLDTALAGIEWPETVDGCALVQEVVALPPQAEQDMPADADPAAYAAAHPQRQEIRLAVGVLRDGTRSAVVRVRDGHRPEQIGAENGPEGSLIVDADLAPQLANALLATLQPS